MKTAKCRSCQADILWLSNTATGRLMPVDALPSEKGNVAINEGRCEVLGVALAEEQRAIGARLHLNHFVTCPNAKSHRKEKS